MPVRVVVTGSECTGKSTMAAALADRFGVPYAPEFLRDYFIMKEGVLTVEDAVPIAQGQINGEDALVRQGVNPVICDTNILSSVIYSRHYFGHCPEWIERQMRERAYDHYLLCGIDVPWVADGQRDRPAEREAMQNLFRNELKARGLPFTEVKGSVEERLAAAIPIVESLLIS
ncbi:AAA family ATPase [Salidesulfovibrio brasiliensis]|uniref:AAA family ATPase n=1 Tax=Salidesulfovibrio brasiliensis TaxID=221711 RepID=UPI0006D1A246|nr:ATP-binding protein [Salidesulfovibrio brasiliensis]